MSATTTDSQALLKATDVARDPHALLDADLYLLPAEGVTGGPQAAAATTAAIGDQTVETQQVLQCSSAL